jgi:hypothetical protein
MQHHERSNCPHPQLWKIQNNEPDASQDHARTASVEATDTRLEARMKERPSLKEAPSVMIESRFATTSDASCVTCAERDNQLRSR